MQEGYHMENLIHETLWRLTPQKQPLSEAELAPTIKKAILGSAGGLIPRAAVTAS